MIVSPAEAFACLLNRTLPWQMLPLRVFVQSTGIREENCPTDGAGTVFFLPHLLPCIPWSIQCTYLDATVMLTVSASVYIHTPGHHTVLHSLPFS